MSQKMTQEQIEFNRKTISKELFRLKELKTKLDNAMTFVVCFYWSPVSTTVEHRMGAFEDSSEAYLFKESLEKTYTKFDIPHSTYLL